MANIIYLSLSPGRRGSFLPSLKSEPRITNERVVRGRHYKAKPLFIILTRQFARNIPVDSVTLVQKRSFYPAYP